MNLFFRILLVLVFIGVAIFAFVRQFGSGQWRRFKEGEKVGNLITSRRIGWFLVGVAAVALVAFLGVYNMEQKALEREQAREKRAALKEKAISSLYAADSGEWMDNIIVDYETKDGDVYSKNLSHYERDFGRITPQLGLEDSYFFESVQGKAQPVYKTHPPNNPFRVHAGDTLRLVVKEPRRTKHCTREPLVKWGVASGYGNAGMQRIFKLGSPHYFKVRKQGHPVLEVFCITESGGVDRISVETIKLQK